MKIQLGDILMARNGKYYRVVEYREGIVSLIRVNGYTLFSCNMEYAESMFSLPISCASS
ncbi:MAG: hypothetical protein WCA35_30025 [Kovacikia sp.]